MKSILFYTGLLAGTFWACGGGGNEEPTPEPPIPSVEKIEMKVAVSGIQAWGEMGEKFEDGQNIGLFAVNRENAGTQARLTSASGNQVNNVKNTLQSDGKTWKAASTIYWKDANTVVDAYAYYPWVSTPSGAEVTQWPVTVKSDQTKEEDGKASDFLWAHSSGQKAGSDGVLSLTFQHLLSKIILNIKIEDAIKDVYTINGVKFTALQTTATCDLNTGDVTALQENKSEMIPYDKTPDKQNLELIVIPQHIVAAKFLKVEVNIGEGVIRTFEYNLSEDLQGERGKLYTLEVTVEKESEPLKPIDVKISDWVSGGNQDVETD